MGVMDAIFCFVLLTEFIHIFKAVCFSRSSFAGFNKGFKCRLCCMAQRNTFNHLFIFKLDADGLLFSQTLTDLFARKEAHNHRVEQRLINSQAEIFTINQHGRLDIQLLIAMVNCNSGNPFGFFGR